MTTRAALFLLVALPVAGAGAHALSRRVVDRGIGVHDPTIPPRPPHALGGTAFMEQLSGIPAAARQHAIMAQILEGNVPRFLRSFRPVQLVGTTRGGRTVTATVWVMPDYLSVGSNRDFVRVPLDLPTAETIARVLDLCLPTRKVVDAVYKQAAVHLRPIPLPPGPWMRSPQYVLEHNRSIEAERAGMPLGPLTAGQKKDVVLSRRLRMHPGRVAIYGWHLAVGHPIQPLSTVHGALYADYSHGVRFVAPIVLVDGVARNYFDVLGDPVLGPVLSYDGGIPSPRTLQNAASRTEDP